MYQYRNLRVEQVQPDGSLIVLKHSDGKLTETVSGVQLRITYLHDLPSHLTATPEGEPDERVLDITVPADSVFTEFVDPMPPPSPDSPPLFNMARDLIVEEA